MQEDKAIVLRVEDIYKKYGNVEVLKGVSFEIKRGETKVIIGPSGSGKSTLLRCINQLTIPDKGRIWLENEEVTHTRKNINQFRQKIGMVFQDFNLFDHLNALRNVEIGLIKVKGMGKDNARQKAIEGLKQVGLEEQAYLYPAQLSGGQKQRVSIARTLAMDPSVILFDEPTSALDPELIGEVLEVIKKLALNGMTMTVVTHEMGFARSVANEVIFMENGKIIDQGSPHKLFTNPKHERTRKFLYKITELYGRSAEKK
ncbi:MAG TPA: amino acid ABC transporter ATP-binding protein [Candidatus Atribacteria bacterium]|nr:amino acid ABC transporter ATP-binding protein [Candidatus Atribacteria bacterium]